jgi:hypothetical protein
VSSLAIWTSWLTPSRSRIWKESAGRIFFSTFSGTKPPMSSREKPNVICVRSLVPKEKNSAVPAILSAVSAAGCNRARGRVWTCGKAAR